MRYLIPFDQGEFPVNKLGLINADEIAVVEFEGFLKAELMLTEQLSRKTKFDCRYLLNIHSLAMSDLYDFAGKWRNVNLSKGGFLFASAQFLPQIMHEFEKAFLKTFSIKFTSISELIEHVARSHAELLFIHPFREGNGRTSRVLANLMFRKHGSDIPDWTQLDQNKFQEYVRAVQQVAHKNYEPMISLMNQLF
ncbi:Fic/DOC family protein [Dyadobacter arcticus]|uniref:protein adenylyltransferase n=1 Tax=Dyadobacter arcticus TaxID=1078754 RepID=A0ABX0USN7_9BACT|nr:Fic family protein [Dyadobacter arcticus]NIJ54765.1 cell filamentation protein [Dyadobacter arcticus]